MKKLVGFLAGLLAVMLIAFCGCSSNKIPERPEDWNAECWIAEDVIRHEWDENGYVEAGCGFVEHYDRAIAKGEHGEITTEYYVKYLLGYLPQFSPAGYYVKKITVTDPAITMYGLTCESTYDEFCAVFKEKGYEVTNNEQYKICTASKSGISFSINQIQKVLVIEVDEVN